MSQTKQSLKSIKSIQHWIQIGCFPRYKIIQRRNCKELIRNYERNWAIWRSIPIPIPIPFKLEILNSNSNSKFLFERNVQFQFQFIIPELELELEFNSTIPGISSQPCSPLSYIFIELFSLFPVFLCYDKFPLHAWHCKVTFHDSWKLLLLP